MRYIFRKLQVSKATVRSAIFAALAFVAVSALSLPNALAQAPGSAEAWGFNSQGQLGDGTQTTRLTPVAVTGLGNVTAIAAARADHSLALLADGTVMAWGNNVVGQLGDGTMTNRLTPVAVTGLGGVTAIAGGGFHSLALLGDGTVMAWGANEAGQLGDGTTTDRHTPVAVTELSNATAIAGGRSHTLAGF